MAGSSVDGLVSGMSTSSLISQLMQVEAAPQTALKNKTVLPLATGGSPNHMLALDYALRPVLQSLSARHILPNSTVYQRPPMKKKAREAKITPRIDRSLMA